MNLSTKIGRAFGIDVFVHWTFILIPIMIAWSAFSAGHGLTVALLSLAFTLVIFACVVMHEFGHALMARRFGVETRDIILLPIGGLARLERMPRQPVHELLIALAGPAVNVVIATLLLIVMLPLVGLSGLLSPSLFGAGFVVAILYANVILTIFNLLPAFPMDGGRVLRACLAMMIDYRDATRFAGRVGQFIAILMAIAGLFSLNFPLLLVAAFVFMAAAAEIRTVTTPIPVPTWNAARQPTQYPWTSSSVDRPPSMDDSAHSSHAHHTKPHRTTSHSNTSHSATSHSAASHSAASHSAARPTHSHPPTSSYKIHLPNGSTLIVKGFKCHGS